MTTMMPIVSVVIPFYNAEHFIAEAIESVLAQEYSGWELLLVDDGSRDSSRVIVEKYCQVYPDRIRCLDHDQHCNLGQAPSRNLAVKVARGEYIAFLDADDVWFPSKLNEQVDILESHPEAGMVYGPGLVWYSWTGKIEDGSRDFLTTPPVPANEVVMPPALALRCYPLGQGFGPDPSSVMLRRDLFDRVGGFDEQFSRLYDDQALFVKIYLSTPVFVSSSCWHKYRRHPDSCCAQMREGYHSTRLRFLLWLSQYWLDSGVSNPALWKVWNRAIWPYRHPDLYRSTKALMNVVARMKGLLRRNANTLLEFDHRSNI